MAEQEIYLKQFVQKLLLSIEQGNDKNDDTIIQNGKTYINKELITKLLTIKNHQLTKSKKYKYVHIYFLLYTIICL